jgi:hypothetical protein
MTLYRCCPTDCFDDCCEYMAACDPGQPTSILYEVEVYCTRKYYIDGTLHTTVVIADYEYSYEATDWTTHTYNPGCGVINSYKASTVRYRLDGSILASTSETPENTGTGGCFGGSCLGPILPCQDWCGPGCLTCKDSDWRWCVDYNDYTKNAVLADYEAEYTCCLDNGCHKMCISFDCLPGAECYDTSGTWSQTVNCCGSTAITPQAFQTAHQDFDISGRCGCVGTNTWTNLYITNFAWGAFTGSGNFVGGSPQTVCTDITTPSVTVIERGCGCEDYTTSPPTVNYVECQQSKLYWQDCCTYTVKVTVT